MPPKCYFCFVNPWFRCGSAPFDLYIPVLVSKHDLKRFSKSDIFRFTGGGSMDFYPLFASRLMCNYGIACSPFAIRFLLFANFFVMCCLACMAISPFCMLGLPVTLHQPVENVWLSNACFPAPPGLHIHVWHLSLGVRDPSGLCPDPPRNLHIRRGLWPLGV